MTKIEFVKIRFILFLIAGAVCLRIDAQTNSIPSPETSAPTVQTLVCIRHGEKPKGGLGQLTCRGLNRALALPKVLLEKYGTPQFIFAPNPTQKVDGNKYNYVRPLTTIEPTAIRCGLPVNTQFGYLEIQGLESELQKTNYPSATIFIAGTWPAGSTGKKPGQGQRRRSKAGSQLAGKRLRHDFPH